MDDWEDAYAKLQALHGSQGTRASQASSEAGSSTRRKKWEPPAEGWQDVLPPQPRVPPRPSGERTAPDELEQLHALSISSSSGHRRAAAAASSSSSTAPRAAGRSSAHGRASSAPGPRFPDTVVPAFREGPRDPQGLLTDLSDRPNLCASVDWGAGEAVVGSSDHALYGVDVRSGRLRRTLYTKKHGHTEWVTCVAHSASGKVLSGGMDSKICVWPAHGTVCQTLEGHSASVSQIRVDPGSGLAVSCSYDKSVKVWDVESSRPRLASSLEGHAAPVLELEAGPSGALVSGDRSGNVLVWDLGSGRHSWPMKNVHRGHITSLAWWCDGGGGADVFLSGGQDGCLRAWDRRERSCVASLELHVNEKGVGALSDIIPPLPATSGKIVTAGADGVVRVLDARRPLSELHAVRVTNFVYSCAAAGGLVLVGCGDGALHVIDVELGSTLYALGANQAAVRTVDAAADRIICSGDDGNVILYEF